MALLARITPRICLICSERVQWVDKRSTVNYEVGVSLRIYYVKKIFKNL